ncbi:3-hydroxybutyryl-CoA dehydrogenase [Streptomyces goshikiensis]|uniref:3-hydroxybutyryl-CoA dehydrogenase n=1 Tax=Streptomyces goshikiensis TaxID=1942 RepID=UPI0036C9CEE7
MDDRLQRVGVVGCGTMGAGIAESALSAGLDVRIAVASEAAVGRAKDRLLKVFDRAVAKERMTPEGRAGCEARLSIVPDLYELADRQLVVEAVVEDLAVKDAVFKTLDTALEDPDSVITTTTSSFLVADLAACTTRPQSVIGLHFFNPVTAMPLVEVVRTPHTSAKAEAVAQVFVSDFLGKEVIHVQDRCGFVVNALLVPYLMAAVRMYEQGVASAKDIDRGMTLGCGHPIGPLALLDMIGLDTMVAVVQSMIAGSDDLVAGVPPLLIEMVETGRTGRKAGHGFFRYEPYGDSPRRS